MPATTNPLLSSDQLTEFTGQATAKLNSRLSSLDSKVGVVFQGSLT